MAWFFTANVIIAIFLVGLSQSQVEHNQPTYSGTCASIGYSTKCCPPSSGSGDPCKASDGNCRCDGKCHSEYRNDCCEDVFCISSTTNIIKFRIIACMDIIMLNNILFAEPKTCQDIGCCNNDSVDVSERCGAVYLYDENGTLVSPRNGQRCNRFTDCRKFHEYVCLIMTWLMQYYSSYLCWS